MKRINKGWTIRGGLLWIGGSLFILGASLDAQQGVNGPRTPSFTREKAKDTPIASQTLTRYEFAIAMKELMTRLEKGLTEGFQKPISTGTAGALKTDSRHPAWAREAVAELQVRRLIDPKKPFNGNQPLTRYDFAQMISRYVQRLDQTVTSVAGKPVRTFSGNLSVTLNLSKKHPAYNSVLYLARNGWLPYTSVVFRGSRDNLTTKEVADSLAHITTRFVERYTNEPVLWERKQN